MRAASVYLARVQETGAKAPAKTREDPGRGRALQPPSRAPPPRCGHGRPHCAAPKMPWLDPQGHWLCGAFERDKESDSRSTWCAAAALASMRRVASVEGASPRRKATAARKGALEVVDALLGHSPFGSQPRRRRVDGVKCESSFPREPR